MFQGLYKGFSSEGYPHRPSQKGFVGELPNSHGRTLTDKSEFLHGMPYKSTKNKT
jgi:hypothetical protein